MSCCALESLVSPHDHPTALMLPGADIVMPAVAADFHLAPPAKPQPTFVGPTQGRDRRRQAREGLVEVIRRTFVECVFLGLGRWAVPSVCASGFQGGRMLRTPVHTSPCVRQPAHGTAFLFSPHHLPLSHVHMNDSTECNGWYSTREIDRGWVESKCFVTPCSRAPMFQKPDPLPYSRTASRRGGQQPAPQIPRWFPCSARVETNDTIKFYKMVELGVLPRIVSTPPLL